MGNKTKQTMGAELAAAHEIMTNLLAFTLYTLENLNQVAAAKVSLGAVKTMDGGARLTLHKLALAVAHDLSGHLTGRQCWLPQTYGWASHAAALKAAKDHAPVAPSGPIRTGLAEV